MKWPGAGLSKSPLGLLRRRPAGRVHAGERLPPCPERPPITTTRSAVSSDQGTSPGCSAAPFGPPSKEFPSRLSQIPNFFIFL